MRACVCVNHTEASPAAEPRARGHCQAAGMEFSLLWGTSPFSHTGTWLFLLSPHLVSARWRWLEVLTVPWPPAHPVCPAVPCGWELGAWLGTGQGWGFSPKT